MSTISKGKYYKKPGMLSGGLLQREPIAPLLLGLLFFFVVCLSASDSMPVTMLLTAVFMLIVIAVRLDVLRERICIPFLALALYVIMDGVSTFWALAPKFALREFLKVFLAFALAVIFLATSPKREEQAGRRVATILAVCAALGSMVSIDMLSTRIISGAWLWIMGRFTEAYSNLTPVLEGTRMNSMFVNPNPYAGFAAVGVLLSLGLTITAANTKERCVDMVLLYISSLGFLLAFSMGGCIFIALAFLVFLAMEREKRVELLFLMVETAVLVGISTALIAATSFRNTEEIQIIPLACAILGAAALCVLDVFAVRKTAEKLRMHGKKVWIVIAVLLVLGCVFVVVAWNWTDGVTLEPGESVRRSVYPEPGEYSLEIESDGPVRVTVYSQNRQETIMHTNTRLYRGDAAKAVFTVPEDSKVVYFSFSAKNGAKIASASVGGEKIPLHYKLLPSFIANRLQGLWANQNAMMRLAHFEDGMKLFRRSPIVGLGMGSFENAIKSVQGFYYETKYAHNHYIQALLDTGVIGLVLFLAILVTNAIAIWKAFRRKQLFAPMLGAAFVFMFGHATMEIDFSNNAFLPMAFGTFSIISLTCGEIIEKPKLSKTVKNIAIGVIAACTLVYCGFIVGNRMAKQLLKRQPTPQTLVRCSEIDRFEWADYALPYVINSMKDEEGIYDPEQADVLAERLAKVSSNTIPIYLAEYYFRSDRTEEGVEMVEKYVHYLASDEKAWNTSFQLLAAYEDDSKAFRGGARRVVEWLDTWTSENPGEINLDDSAKAFVEKYRT